MSTSDPRFYEVRFRTMSGTESTATCALRGPQTEADIPAMIKIRNGAASEVLDIRRLDNGSEPR